MSPVETLLAEVDGLHFVMWEQRGEDSGPDGEWVCACGKRFGFSDSAIEHRAAEQAKTLQAWVIADGRSKFAAYRALADLIGGTS